MENQTFSSTFNSTMNGGQSYNPFEDPFSSEGKFMTYFMYFLTIPLLSIISIFIMPFETASIRWYTEYRPKNKIDTHESEVKSYYQMFKRIKRKEGISGYYKGNHYEL